MKKPVMLCIGKAGQDTFLQGEVFTPKCEAGVCYEHIKLGDKYYVDDAVVSVGGNAANAATTFARQRLETYFIGALGTDTIGQAILQALDGEHINTSYTVQEPNHRSSFSTILLAPTGERTILDYPGTLKLPRSAVNLTEFPEEINWLYISSVGSMELLEYIMKSAKKQSVKIAFNPASYELKYIQETANLLQYVDLLAVNKEEAALFVEGKSSHQLVKQLVESVRYVLVSDGPRGSVASDGVTVVEAGMYRDVPVVDRTGAGDAFASGFVVEIAKGKSLEEAITFASANSTSVVSQIGASAGILPANAKLSSMDLKTNRL